MINIIFNEQEDDWWTCTEYELQEDESNIRLTFTSDDEPTQEYVNMAVSHITKIKELTLKASKLILENYSYDHFKKLGVEENLLLKEETPCAMSKVVSLSSLWFMDQEGKEFEMSFTIPWDDHHSFDVEFESGEATYCSVNG